MFCFPEFPAYSRGKSPPDSAFVAMTRTAGMIYSDEEPLVRKDRADGASSLLGGCWGPCCQCYCCCCCSIFVFLLWVVLMAWTTQCGLTSFPVEHVLPENAIQAGVVPLFKMGTSANMNIDPALGIDLTGTWWMDGNPFTIEQLVSFAGGAGQGPFPAHLMMPTNLAGQWTWSDSIFGRIVMGWYNFISTVDETHDFMFVNSSYAEIDPVDETTFGDNIFPFEKISDDEWLREVYVLRRIIYEDGTPHPVQWQRFLDWYYTTWPSGQMVVYTTNNQCIRRCEFLLPCFICKSICGPM